MAGFSDLFRMMEVEAEVRGLTGEISALQKFIQERGTGADRQLVLCALGAVYYMHVIEAERDPRAARTMEQIDTAALKVAQTVMAK